MDHEQGQQILAQLEKMEGYLVTISDCAKWILGFVAVGIGFYIFHVLKVG